MIQPSCRKACEGWLWINRDDSSRHVLKCCWSYILEILLAAAQNFTISFQQVGAGLQRIHIDNGVGSCNLIAHLS